MQFASLGSGSKGNATLVEGRDTLVLVDCGFSIKQVRKRIESLNRSCDDIEAILVTHEHGDHIKGVGALARNLSVPVYVTVGTQRAARDLHGVELRQISPHHHFQVGCLDIEPVAVPHDAREPCQFVFAQNGRRLGVLTDLGSITSHVIDCYERCDALLLECNHDQDMLYEGAYPWPLKQRVGGDWGHLNNDQAAALLRSVDRSCLQHLVVAHISEQNNTEEKARAAVAAELGDATRLSVAKQDEGFDWLRVD